MTNFVFTAITVVLTTNTVEIDEPNRSDVKLRENIVTESHAYEINGKPFYRVFQPTTNVVRLELRWIEAPQEKTVPVNGQARAPVSDPQSISQANCVTRIYDAILFIEDGTNIVANSFAVAKSKAVPLALNRVNAEIGKPLTADEAARLCLPPVPQYIQAMTKKPKL